MAPRVAAFEHRLAAVVADPGQLDVGGKFTAMAGMFGLDAAAVARLPELSPDDEAAMMKVIAGDRGLHWKIIQRGFWTNGGVQHLGVPRRDGQVEAGPGDRRPDPSARCSSPPPSRDMASSNAKDLYDALPGRKQFVQFTNADGAGDHCEIFNRSLANRVILDWLDDTLGTAG